MAFEERMDLSLVKLGPEPYVSWKRHMTNVLKAKGLYGVVVGDEKPDAIQDCQTQALLGSALDKVNRMNIIDCTTAKDIWLRLESIYEMKTSFETQNLQTKLNTYKIPSLAKISESIAEIRYLAAKLAMLGEPVRESNLMSILLSALPKPLKHVQTTWKVMSAGDRSLENLVSFILSEAADVEKPEETALVAKQQQGNRNNRYQRSDKNRRKKNNGGQKHANRDSSPKDGKSNTTCNYCKKPGHWVKDCRKLQRKNEEDGKSGGKKYNSNNQSSSKSQREATDGKEETVWALMAKRIDTPTITTNWIVDSGCTIHMTSNLEWITNYQPFEQALEIALGDDRVIHAKGSGTIITTLGEMRSVHYVPDITYNLYSIRSATKNNLQVQFEDDRLIFSCQDKRIITGYYTQGLYRINLEIKPCKEKALTAATIDEWHQRLGHVSIDTIKRMAQTSAVEGLKIIENKDKICEDCAMGKCKRSSHPSKTTSKVRKPGQSLHLDTAGPIPEPSLKGSRYFVLSKDEHSGYRQVTFVASKAEIPDQVKTIISSAEVDTGNKVLRIVTDNGTEFTNERLKTFLDERGIVHKLSAPYTPQQNGYIERDIRTVVESARTLLVKAQLPKKLWAEAVNTSVYILNRTLSAGSTMTPFELWFGTKPNINNLHRFGQPVIKLVYDHQRDKFDEKGISLIFVGYTDDYNTYRLYDPESDETTVACDVKFVDEVRDRSNQLVGHSDDEIRVSHQIGESTRFSICESTSASGNTTDNSNQDVDEEGYYYDTPQINSPPEYNDQQPGVSSPPFESSSRAIASAPTTPRKGPRPSQIDPRHIIPSRLRTRNPDVRYHAKLSTIEAYDDPQSYTEAMQRTDKKQWIKAMQEEIDSLNKNQVWTLVDRPNCNVVTNKWVLKIKRKPNGEVERYRARLVARGFSQVQGIDYHETYAPVVNMVSIRMLFAYAAIEHLQMAQFDIKTAFLYGHLDETVFMEQPEGFVTDKNKVCLLKKSLYGLKQAPRQWNIEFTNFLKLMKMNVSSHDECIFYRKEPLLIIAIYVDDGVIFSDNRNSIEYALKLLSQRFEIHSVESSTFLGFQVHRGTNNEIVIHQKSYVNKILKKYDMDESNPIDAPITLTQSKEDEPLIQEDIPYREAIGSLMYAAVITRIDISYAVSKASRRVSEPRESDWKAVKKIFRYLREKEHFGIEYSRAKNQGLVVYCDSDFAGDKDTSRSTTGAVYLFGGGPIHWKSQRQSLVTLSSTEAEFVSICSTVKEIIWIRKLALELGIIDNQPTTLYCDNESAIRIASNEKSIHRTRHMSVQAAYPKEQIEKGEIRIEHVRSEHQLADMLTKATTIPNFKRNRNKLMSINASIACIMCILTFVTLNDSYVFQRVKPLIWIPTNHFVEIGFTQYHLDFNFRNPCDIIVQEAVHPQSQKIAEKADTDYRVYEGLQNDCLTLYEREWRQRMLTFYSYGPANKGRGFKIPRKLVRRGIGFGSVFGVVIGLCISNLISTVFNGYKPIEERGSEVKTFEERIGHHDDLLRKFEKNFNITYEVQRGAIKSMDAINKSLREQNRKLEHLVQLLPHFTWTAAFIQSKIIMAATDLKRIMDEFLMGRVAINELSDLLNITTLKGIDNEDTHFVSVKQGASPNNLLMNFIVLNQSPDTFVYKTNAFRYWDNLTATPTYIEYQGSKYLIYNETSNCMKAIEEPAYRGVIERCIEQDYQDPRLKVWRALHSTKDIYSNQSYTPVEVQRTQQFNYIYCFPWNITLDNSNHRCPPYVFRLPVNQTFNTSIYNYDEVDVSMTITQTQPMAVENVHRGHFDDESEAADELKMIDALQQLQIKLHEMKLESENSITIRYEYVPQIFYVTSSIVLILLLVLSLRFYISIAANKRRLRAAQEISNAISGSISEPIRRSSGTQMREYGNLSPVEANKLLPPNPPTTSSAMTTSGDASYPPLPNGYSEASILRDLIKRHGRRRKI